MNPILQLKNVSRNFGTQQILRDISVDIIAGETLVIVGESGCGKSVTLKLLMALMPTSSGDVRWYGRSTNEYTDQELHNQRIKFGFLFQGAALFDSLNVYENVAFGLRQNRAESESAIRNNVQERLKEVGLPKSVCAKKPAELSGGMKKRVALARALAMQPEVMVYDEPTTGLDPIMTDVINELILQTSSLRNMTSIVVTHEMTTVRKVADRLIMLYPLSRLEPHEPQIVFEGSANDAFVSSDQRVSQFVYGQAGQRLQELANAE